VEGRVAVEVASGLAMARIDAQRPAECGFGVTVCADFQMQHAQVGVRVRVPGQAGRLAHRRGGLGEPIQSAQAHRHRALAQRMLRYALRELPCANVRLLELPLFDQPDDRLNFAFQRGLTDQQFDKLQFTSCRSSPKIRASPAWAIASCRRQGGERMKKLAAALVTLLLLEPIASNAQTAYPTKPVHIVVGFAAGGGTDIMTRIVAPRLAEKLGQPVIVENRPGSGGNIATEAVVRAAPDGYTLLMGTIAALAVNPSLYKDLPFDPVTDLAPISLGVSLANVVVVSPSLPAKTLPELITLAKQRPGKITYSSSGNGTGGHLSGALFESMAGVQLMHVPYKSGGQAMTDLLGGHVDMSFAAAPGALPQIKAGKIRALAVTTRERSAFLPDVPTVAEASGIKGYESTNWYGLVGPAKLPRAIIDKLNEAMRDALTNPAIREKLALQGLESTPSSPEEFGTFLRSEIAKWGKVIRDTNTRPD
jgi:tripartite-type tricarboxylate transporter receptor subunit TctC